MAETTGWNVRRIATGLLVAMTLVFIVATIVERSHPWVAWIRVTAEASMVGALADWFAVVALFRHPFGIPIPHTAIIPSRKEQIGRALGRFVQESFLTRENVVARVRQADAGTRIGLWLEDPAHVAQVGRQVTEGIAAVVASLDDDELGPAVAELVLERLRSIHFAPLASRTIAAATAEGRHQELLDAFLPALGRTLDENRRSLLDAVAASSPWWVPRALDETVLEKALEVAHRFIRDVVANPHHEFRGHVDTLAEELVRRLRDDPTLIARGEELKTELLSNPAVQHYLDGIWEGTKSNLLSQAENPESPIRARVEAAVAGFGRSLRTDGELRNRVEVWLTRIVGEIADRFEAEINDLVTTTVDHWDAVETSERLEELIGRDLQFIRINGTIVGGLAGLIIYATSRLIG